MAADKVIDKARALAAHQLEVAEDDLEFADGVFRVAGSPDKEMAIQALAFAAFTAHDLPDGMEPNLNGSVTWDPPNFVFPFGTPHRGGRDRHGDRHGRRWSTTSPSTTAATR